MIPPDLGLPEQMRANDWLLAKVTDDYGVSISFWPVNQCAIRVFPIAKNTGLGYSFCIETVKSLSSVTSAYMRGYRHLDWEGNSLLLLSTIYDILNTLTSGASYASRTNRVDA